MVKDIHLLVQVQTQFSDPLDLGRSAKILKMHRQFFIDYGLESKLIPYCNQGQ